MPTVNHLLLFWIGLWFGVNRAILDSLDIYRANNRAIEALDRALA